MTEKHAGAWARTSRIIKAPPEKLYEAFMDPAVLIAWLPPAEMTGKIHEFDVRLGGRAIAFGFCDPSVAVRGEKANSLAKCACPGRSPVPRPKSRHRTISSL